MAGVANKVTPELGPSNLHQSLTIVETAICGKTDRDGAISFGPFCLLPTQRLLLKGDRPVPVGCRALDILIALVERPGELLSKRALMNLVWPNTVVVEANLTVNVASLRRALGDGQAGNRYIINVIGRGYRFVGSVTFEVSRPLASRCETPDHPHPRPAQLPVQRLITVIGQDGVGKQVMARSAVERPTSEGEQGMLLIDIAPLLREWNADEAYKRKA